MDLSIIIVSWNTRDVLAQCLNAIFASAPSCEFDVWVVDNGSSDASEKMVREKFPQVRLIENSDNVGFARANNQAIQQSEGRNIFFLNSDALVRLGAIDQMIEFIDSHSEAGFVGPILTKSDGAVLPSCHRFPTIWSEAIFVWGINARLPLISKHKSPFDLAQIYVETDWLSGAAFMVRRVVLDQVGLFDESYFMYSEEVDLEYRAKRGGSQTLFPHVRHESQRLFGREPPSFSYSYVEGGNVWLLKGAQGEPTAIVGRDHFYQTFLMLDLENRNWEELAKEAGLSFSDLKEKISKNLTEEEIKQQAEKLFALGKGHIPHKAQIDLFMQKYYSGPS